MVYSRDKEIDVVRRQLDDLGALRTTSGLTTGERVRYRELCVSEQAMLNSARP
jgi:hypothetical protein